ncbi:MAG: hypothetical protein RJA25_1722 [Bacteroidota bacterium]|jgi:predicted amidohydrolase
MQSNLCLALVQTNLIWKDKKANLSNIENMILSISDTVDIFILPEMFTTAFCVEDISLAEDENEYTVQWMKQMAEKKQAVICGSILFKENENYFNRFLSVAPDGNIQTYDKFHLFSLVGESTLLTKGKQKSLIQYKGWKIQPFICYDIRFPAWCQNDDNADLQIYVANWPQKRIHHWKLLLQSRAIENQCYVAGVNRLGDDFYKNAHNGQSAVVDFSGLVLAACEDRDGIKIVTINKENLEKHRIRYPFWKDR